MKKLLTIFLMSLSLAVMAQTDVDVQDEVATRFEAGTQLEQKDIRELWQAAGDWGIWTDSTELANNTSPGNNGEWARADASLWIWWSSQWNRVGSGGGGGAFVPLSGNATLSGSDRRWTLGGSGNGLTIVRTFSSDSTRIEIGPSSGLFSSVVSGIDMQMSFIGSSVNISSTNAGAGSDASMVINHLGLITWDIDDAAVTRGMIFDAAGLQYDADYSAGFNSRSLVDSAWVMDEAVPVNSVDLAKISPAGGSANEVLKLNGTPDPIWGLITTGNIFDGGIQEVDLGNVQPKFSATITGSATLDDNDIGTDPHNEWWFKAGPTSPSVYTFDNADVGDRIIFKHTTANAITFTTGTATVQGLTTTTGGTINDLYQAMWETATIVELTNLTAGAGGGGGSFNGFVIKGGTDQAFSDSDVTHISGTLRVLAEPTADADYTLNQGLAGQVIEFTMNSAFIITPVAGSGMSVQGSFDLDEQWNYASFTWTTATNGVWKVEGHGFGGQVNITENAATTYTTKITDEFVRNISSSTTVITVAPFSSVPYEVGHILVFRRAGTGSNEILPGAGVVFNTNDTDPAGDYIILAQHKEVSFVNVAENVWDAMGAFDTGDGYGSWNTVTLDANWTNEAGFTAKWRYHVVDGEEWIQFNGAAIEKTGGGDETTDIAFDLTAAGVDGLRTYRTNINVQPDGSNTWDPAFFSFDASEAGSIVMQDAGGTNGVKQSDTFWLPTCEIPLGHY